MSDQGIPLNPVKDVGASAPKGEDELKSSLTQPPGYSVYPPPNAGPHLHAPAYSQQPIGYPPSQVAAPIITQPYGYSQPAGAAPYYQGGGAGYPPNQGMPGYPPAGYNAFPTANQPPAPPGPPPPANDGWMLMPQGPPNCPPGLEYLTLIDQLLVHQKMELLEAFTGFETQNKFSIKNSLGQKVYFAAEESDCLTRQCCGPIRPFELAILDNFQNRVIHMHRPLNCDSCCCPCCLQRMEIFSPPGTLIGVVQQEWSICYPTYAIKDASGDTVLRVEGPFCKCSCFGDVNFRVTSKDGKNEVGKITKQFSGLVREAYTDADFFGITFPMDLDVRMKAVLLGALFLIDVMYFERNE